MDNWLPTLTTPTPSEGSDLAGRLAGMTARKTQPDAVIRDRLRPDYAENADSLIAVSAIVDTHFATIAAAHRYWGDDA